MSSANKICRVCGRGYKACRSAHREAGVFRWQEVACSPECGAIYLNKIIESRKPADVVKRYSRKKEVFETATETVLENAEEDSVVDDIFSTENE
jgi:hypothetical protein